MRSAVSTLFFIFGATATEAFVPSTIRSSSPASRQLILRLSDENEGGEKRRLLLSQEEIAEKMNQLRSKYPTSEADYLAAARARSEAKLPSVERQATEEDWQRVAREKKQLYGEQDDWEESAKEAGNIDSQILLPMMDDDGEGGEPKLLL